MLIPCTDAWCEAVAALATEPGGRFVASMPSPDVVETFLDKWRLAELLDRFGIAHPTTHELVSETQLAMVGSRFFIKPRHSGSFYDAFGRKAVRIADRTAAAEVFRSITAAGFAAVLQEYIPGPPTAHTFIDGFIDRGGTVRALFARRRVRMHPPDFGNSSMTVSIPLGEVHDDARNLQRLLAGVRYRGAFSAELKHDPRDGLNKLLEVNCRPWWFIGFAADCGVDIALMIYRDAIGLPVATIDGYIVGGRCGVLTHDISAYLSSRSDGTLGFREWARSWIGATSSTFELRDPIPTLDSLVTIARRKLTRGRPSRSATHERHAA